MNMLLILSIFFLKINDLNGLTTSDLCRINGKSQIKCSEPYYFDCYQKYCTKSIQTCEDVSILEKMTKIERHFRTKIKFKSIIESIQKCINNNKNKFKSTDICIKSDKCYEIDKNYFLGTKYNFINSYKICTCSDKHSFKCHGNNNYCGTNKKSCDELIATNTTFQTCGKLYISLKIIWVCYLIFQITVKTVQNRSKPFKIV